MTEDKYDPDTGSRITIESDYDFRTMAGYFPELIVGETLLENGWLPLYNDVMLFDADFNELDPSDVLTAEMLYRLGPGTYHVVLKRKYNTGYVEEAGAYDTNESLFFAKLVVPESTAGMAGQWAALGGFSWDDVTQVTVGTRAGEDVQTMSADADGIVRLTARLSTTPEAPAAGDGRRTRPGAGDDAVGQRRRFGARLLVGGISLARHGRHTVCGGCTAVAVRGADVIGAGQLADIGAGGDRAGRA